MKFRKFEVKVREIRIKEIDFTRRRKKREEIMFRKKRKRKNK